MSEDTLEAVLARGRAAEALLNNEALSEALETLATDAINRWRDTSARDLDGREILYAHISAIDGLKALLTSRFEQAKALAFEAERKQQRAEAQAKRGARTFGLLNPVR